MKYIKYLLLLSILSYSILALTIGEESLFKAIEEKNSQNVSSILSGDTNININVLDANGYAPIHRAIYNNDLATVNELLKNTNLNINSKLDIRVAIDGWYLGGASPLILASYLGYTNIVETLLNNNANIKAKDDVDGSMAIHMAAANGNNDIIKILLSKDETIINEKDNKGNTPLHWASMKDKPETIKLLVENGADIESKDIDGWTPLHYASAFSSLETVENLINLGADTKSKFKPADAVQGYIKLTFDYSLFFTDNLAMNFGLYLGYDTPLTATARDASYFTDLFAERVNVHDFNVGLQLGFRFGPKA